MGLIGRLYITRRSRLCPSFDANGMKERLEQKPLIFEETSRARFVNKGDMENTLTLNCLHICNKGNLVHRIYYDKAKPDCCDPMHSVTTVWTSLHFQILRKYINVKISS